MQEVFILIFSVVLTITTGAGVIAVTLLKSVDKNKWTLLGDGYVVGLICVTAILRSYDAPNYTVCIHNIWVWLLSVSLISWALVAILTNNRAPPLAPDGNHVFTIRWQYLLCTLLISMIAVRYFGILSEVAVRPVFAWDAISSWVQRAQEWYLGAPENELRPDWATNSWYLGPRVETFASYPHPFTPSLISLWGMIAAGSQEAPLLGIFWALAPLFLGLSVYGHLRLVGCSVVFSILGFYGISSLPYLNTHAILHGYAEIWMALFLFVGIMHLVCYQKNKQIGHLIVGLLVLVSCVFVKRTGIIFAGMAFFSYFVATRPRFCGIISLAFIAAAVILVASGSTNFQVHLPVIGRVGVDFPHVFVGTLGGYELFYKNSIPSISQGMFVMFNWNLLFYALPVLVFTGFQYKVFSTSKELLVPALLAFSILIFLILCSSFLELYHTWVADQTITNRVSLYAAPLLIFFGITVIAKGPFRGGNNPPSPGNSPALPTAKL